MDMEINFLNIDDKNTINIYAMKFCSKCLLILRMCLASLTSITSFLFTEKDE